MTLSWHWAPVRGIGIATVLLYFITNKIFIIRTISPSNSSFHGSSRDVLTLKVMGVKKDFLWFQLSSLSDFVVGPPHDPLPCSTVHIDFWVLGRDMNTVTTPQWPFALSHGVRSLSEATWLPSGDIIYDANEMWGWIGHRMDVMNLLHRASHPSQRFPAPAEAKPQPVPLWLMFRVMHLQDYLFWSCHLSVIAAWLFLRLRHWLYFHTSHCEKYLTLPKGELNHRAE